MPDKSERDLSRIGWLDYVLMSVGSCLAVYSAGMSIQQPTISYFCVILVILGAGVSYAVRVFTINSVWIKFDAFFYSAAVMAAIFFSNDLRGIMPEGGFPREIGAAGWLSWMLILGSFATWQDSTLLFQAIPALALFGLVGCYDTYRAVTFAFFAFLICLATLFARAHGREMLRKAAESGYFTRGLAPGTPIPSVETTPGLALKLKKGPWRWIAGPEWALASAMAVVLVSLLGAPVIRESVSGVAGFVKINQPPIKVRSTPASSSGGDIAGQSVRIGRPFSATLPRPLLEAKLDHIRYLRSETYEVYTGRGWFHNVPPPPNGSGEETAPLTTLERFHEKDPESFHFQVQTLRTLRLMPLPPEVLVETLRVESGSIQPSDDGTFEIKSNAGDALVASGTSREPKANSKPVSAYTGPEMTPFLSLTNIPAPVQELALSVTKGKKNDFEKANAISAEISKRVVYNLHAEESPPERDPVEYTLFKEKEGYCTAFASAMVLMARSAGLPARYVQGYLPDERRHESSGPYIVTDADYHAWAELFFNDVGWVVFDPTLAATAKEGEGLGDTGDSRSWYQKGVMLFIVDLLIGLVMLSLVGTGVYYVRNYRQFLNMKSELSRTYIGFNRRLERAVGVRRKVGQTPNEFVLSIKDELGTCYPAVCELNEKFVNALFATEVVNESVVANLQLELKKMAAYLKQNPTVHKKREP